jgi:peptidoglycan/xylan/chitin deacetylase (PgdA/CDA1 family)
MDAEDVMSWKRMIRPATDRVAKYSGLLQAYERRMRSKITVLMYHRILEDAECADYPFPSLVMPRSLFEAQLDYLSERTHVLPVADALRRARERPRGWRPLVCMTFDDGYVDNFEIAAPVLEARGLRGTFFITAGAVQARKPLWYDRAASAWALFGSEETRELLSDGGDTEVPSFETRESWIEWLKLVSGDRRETSIAVLEAKADNDTSPCPLMTADQVRQLSESGHEIGSHTLWHPILTTMAEDERRHEIEGARKLLRQWTKREVTGFCYPNGDFDSEVVRQLREAGHSYACTTQPGRNHEGTDPFQLRRIDVTCDRVSSVDGRFDPLGFRAEICLFREGLRRWADPRGRQSA